MLHIVWEFKAKEERTAEFEAVYGPDGEWASFFRTGTGYIRTELQAVAGKERTYLTVDVWVSREAFEDFQRSWASAYAAIDRRCEDLTERETFLGSYESMDAKDE